jgi:hypothetical protein
MGDRGRAAGDIEDLASKLYCRRADSDFACRDWSDRGTAPKHRNAECKSALAAEPLLDALAAVTSALLR